MDKKFDAIDGPGLKEKTPPTPEIPAAASVASLSKAEASTPKPLVAAGTDSLSEKTDANKLSTPAFRASFTRNFKNVNDTDRANYVSALCKVLDIPTPLNPFYFIPVSGSVDALYAGIEAAQLLAESKRLNIEIRKKSFDKETGLYSIEVRVTGPSGRFSDNEGIMHIGNKTGQDRANMMMKAITKAIRRTVLSYCGLSITDADEDLTGNYGAPSNPLAERTQQLLDQRQPEVLDQRPLEDEAIDKDARVQLFKFLLSGKNPMFKHLKEAESYIRLKTGKAMGELTASECEEIAIDLESEMDQAPAEPRDEQVKGAADVPA